MTKPFPLGVKGARVIIQLDPPETKTLGGIIISSAENEPSNKGLIVATGDGQRLDNGTIYPMTVQVGERVIFNPTQGAPVVVPGNDDEYKHDYIVVNEAHLLAVIEPTTTK